MRQKSIVFILLFCLGFWGYSQEIIVSEIIIKGNKRTKTNFLKRLAFVKEGSVLDSARIASDVRRFKLLPSVASATSVLEKVNDKNYTVSYTVVENFAIIPGLNVSQDNNDNSAKCTFRCWQHIRIFF